MVYWRGWQEKMGEEFISRHAAIEQLASIIKFKAYDCTEEIAEYPAKQAAEDFFSNIPAADVVEVVRCKDCKHYSEEGKVTRYAWCYKWKNAVNFGDFCSYGERAEE